jgi:hypothetical protein
MDDNSSESSGSDGEDSESSRDARVFEEVELEGSSSLETKLGGVVGFNGSRKSTRI